MSTVIVGSGIIGVAAAYYLSEAASVDGATIHLIENSTELFASASGFAGGFVAPDWFSPPVAALGQLSFDLHRQLASKFDGPKLWGYGQSTSLSLAEEFDGGEMSSNGDDEWLFAGTSRAGIASQSADDSHPTSKQISAKQGPPWLRGLSNGTYTAMGKAGSCAQVDPKRLCQFLLQKCQERGVKLHMPAHVTKINYDTDGTLGSVSVSETGTVQESSTILCDRLILTAGAWTGLVFADLFPSASVRLPIGSLAGYSMTIRSPQWTPSQVTDEWHAVFSSRGAEADDDADFSAEMFARTGGVEGESEIYIAGLNDSSLPLPKTATEGRMEPSSVAALKKKAAYMLTVDDAIHSGDSKPDATSDTPAVTAIDPEKLDIIRAGLCWRPVTDRGHAIIGRIDDKLLGKKIRTKPKGGVWMAAGHGPWGISLSLGTGKVLSDMILGLPTSCDVSKLGLRRDR